MADGERRGNAPLWTAALALLTFGLLYGAYRHAMYFDGEPMDGALQFFNPLRRLSLGQRVGADFQVYHGPALPVLLWPLFRLFGGDIFAAELIRQTIVPVALVGGYLIVFGAFTRSWSRTVVLTTIAVLASMALPLMTLLIPGTSILGVRTALPLALVAVLTRPPSRGRMLAEATILGAMPLLSVEQGVVTIVAYMAAMIPAAILGGHRRDDLRRLTAVGALAAGVFTTLTLAIAGRSGAWSLLHYNFVDIPTDQFWYFGAPPNRGLDSYWRLWERLDLTVVLAVGAGATAWLIRDTARRHAWRDPRTMATTVLAYAGLLSTAPLLAIWVSGYTHGLVRALIVWFLIVIDERWERSAEPRRGRRFARAAIGFGVVAALTDTRQLVDAVFAPVSAAVGHHATRIMSADWTTTIAVARREVSPAAGRPSLWSTYPGVVEDALGAAGPPRFDYLIHALGQKNRTDYLNAFQAARPAVVQTIDPRYSPYEEWLETTNWDVYRTVILGYRATATGPWSIFWKRLDHPRAEPTLIREWFGASTETQSLGLRVTGEPRRPQLLEVEVHYAARNPWRVIPVIGRMPRFYVSPAGGATQLIVPLPPYREVVRFPVVMADTGLLVITGFIGSLLPGAHMTITSLRFSRFAPSPDDSLWISAFLEASKQSAQSVRSGAALLPTVR